MVSSFLYKCFWLASAGLALAACGGPSAVDIELIAKAAKLTKSETAAFTVCNSTMAGKSPVLHTPKATWKMSFVPPEVCACQSKTIATIFRVDKFPSYKKFVTYVVKVEQKNPPIFDPADMKSGVNLERVTNRLKVSLLECTITFANANEEVAAKMLEKLEPPAKKVEPIKQASN